MNGIIIQGSISELFGCAPDPCKGSRMDEVVPFQKMKAVLFGRWMYRTQKGIRVKNREWERQIWYYPIQANGNQFQLNKIQFGAFVDAAFYRKKTNETYVFFLDQYFVMKSITDFGNVRKKITQRFNIDIESGERITAAFMDDKRDTAFLISGKRK
ncbi:hypothetical protein B4U80_11811 [Leptotrombidium deliense]|uniref:Uncharacterized protein n=1 Tax=Leptotrombidium deliense TaxID=299467 RepID=A0A443S253_9ACAR|nr:hypothetical protein B4U80_11811 [Leptotrombidium deliense]